MKFARLLPRPRLIVSLLAFGSSILLHAQPVQPAAAPASAVENSVVKIFSTFRLPDPYRPWAKQAPTEGTGSGIVIEGKRILTNAHVVLYASQIEVQANQSGDKVSATVEFIAPGIDLAVLKLDDESFFATHAPLPRASMLPDIKDAVLAYGYPTGGNSLSITKGIVSRIEFVSYNYFVSGLRIQIDAAINPGNSGGPAIVGGKMIGVAFSTLNNAQNIGYIIPCEEVELFLKDIADGHYDGKPAMFDEFQKLQNPALRAFLKVDKSVQGIVVHEPVREDPNDTLRQWDVITKIGDQAIDDEGMVTIANDVRVSFQYQIQKVADKGVVPLTVVRQGKVLAVKLALGTDRPMLEPDLMGEYPSYFVFGPIAFTTGTVQFISGFDHPSVDNLTFAAAPILLRRGDRPAFPGEQLVVVSSPFFPSKLTKGYWRPLGWTVKAVNGITVKNLNQLVEILRDTRDEFISIDFIGRGTETFIFSRQAALAATDDILTDNGIRAQGSPETMAIWRPKGPTP